MDALGMSPSWRALAFILALCVGALVTLQIASTVRLKEAVGETLPAIIASSMVGVLLLGAAMLVMQSPWPSPAKLIGAPPSAWVEYSAQFTQLSPCF